MANTRTVGVRLRPSTYDRLKAIADDAGLHPGRVATLLLDELVPTVKSVRTRLQIEREKPENAKPENAKPENAKPEQR